jgi:hypothetical protein
MQFISSTTVLVQPLSNKVTSSLVRVPRPKAEFLM